MTKKQQKKGKRQSSKPASLRYGLPASSQRAVLGAIQNGKHAKVCALTNPFCQSAKGARVPDDDSAFSTSFQLRTTVNLSTIGTQASISVRADPSELYRQGATYTGTTVDTWGSYNAFADYTDFAAQFDKYRIVSFGVRFYPTVAPTNQAGEYRAVTTADFAGNGIDVNGGLWNSVATSSVAGLDLHYIARPTGVDWKKYVDVSSLSDWDSLTVLFSGLPAAASVPSAVACEIIMNVEVLAKSASVVSALTKPGEDHDPIALGASSKVHAAHTGTHTSGTTMFRKLANFATRALGDVASAYMPMAGSAIRNMLLPPSRPNYPMIVD